MELIIGIAVIFTIWRMAKDFGNKRDATNARHKRAGTLKSVDHIENKEIRERTKNIIDAKRLNDRPFFDDDPEYYASHIREINDTIAEEEARQLDIEKQRYETRYNSKFTTDIFTKPSSLIPHSDLLNRLFTISPTLLPLDLIDSSTTNTLTAWDYFYREQPAPTDSIIEQIEIVLSDEKTRSWLSEVAELGTHALDEEEGPKYNKIISSALTSYSSVARHEFIHDYYLKELVSAAYNSLRLRNISQVNCKMEGHFVKGLAHGAFEITSDSLYYFKGHFFRGLKQGGGLESGIDGDLYEGDFYKGSRSGIGKLETKNGTLRGKFINGKFYKNIDFANFIPPLFWIGLHPSENNLVFVPRNVDINKSGNKTLLGIMPHNWKLIEIELEDMNTPLKVYLDTLESQDKEDTIKQLAIWKDEFQTEMFYIFYSETHPTYVTESLKKDEFINQQREIEKLISWASGHVIDKKSDYLNSLLLYKYEAEQYDDWNKQDW
jgi:hypothetical protein